MVKTINRIDPPLPFETPKGKAFAHFLIDYGIEHHLYWVCFLESTGECWTYDNTKVRMQSNPTVHPQETAKEIVTRVLKNTKLKTKRKHGN